MTLEGIIKDVKNKIYNPVYLLMGEETYYIDKISDFIKDNVLTEAERSFNQHIFYGKEVTALDIDNVSKRYPMMANHQLVIIKEAQDVKNIEDLVYYVSNPLKSTILIIEYKYKKLAKNKKLYKAINKTGVVFESKRLYDNQVHDWINNYVRKKSCTIDPSSVKLLTESLGVNLSKISNEIDKLILILPEGQRNITSEQIERNIGISKDFNNFELQKAFGQKNVLKINRIINYFGDNQKENPLILTIISLYSFYSKLLIYYFIKDKSQRNLASVLKVNPFFVKDYQDAVKRYPSGKIVEIISILREYDLKVKGVNANNTPPKELLQEMAYKIIH